MFIKVLSNILGVVATLFLFVGLICVTAVHPEGPTAAKLKRLVTPSAW